MAESPDAPNTPPVPAAKATPYVGSGAVGTSKAAAAAGVAAVGPEDNVVNQRRRRLVWVRLTTFLTAWFLAFFRFKARHLFQTTVSVAMRPIMDWVWTRNGSRSIASGWIADPIVSLSSTLVVPTSAVRLTGRPAKTSSSVLATEAAMTTKVSISRGQRPGPWTAPSCNWLLTAKSSWTPPAFISGPRVSRAASTIRERICRHESDLNSPQA